MAHGATPEPDEAVAGLPHLIATLERLKHSMIGHAVESYDGVVLDQAGVLDHVIEHLHDVRHALGLEPVDSVFSEMTDGD